MIPYSRTNVFGFYTLTQAELLEKHTLHSCTYPYYFIYTCMEVGYHNLGGKEGGCLAQIKRSAELFIILWRENFMKKELNQPK